MSRIKEPQNRLLEEDKKQRAGSSMRIVITEQIAGGEYCKNHRTDYSRIRIIRTDF